MMDGQVDAGDQLGRLLERVSALEARTSSEIGSLRDDTKSIRSTLHDTNNTLTSFIGQQIGLVNQLKSHVEGCDQRSARMEKAIWVGVAATLAVLGFLLAPKFAPPPPPAETAPPAIVQSAPAKPTTRR